MHPVADCPTEMSGTQEKCSVTYLVNGNENGRA